MGAKCQPTSEKRKLLLSCGIKVCFKVKMSLVIFEQQGPYYECNIITCSSRWSSLSKYTVQLPQMHNCLMKVSNLFHIIYCVFISNNFTFTWQYFKRPRHINSRFSQLFTRQQTHIHANFAKYVCGVSPSLLMASPRTRGSVQISPGPPLTGRMWQLPANTNKTQCAGMPLREGRCNNARPAAEV